MKKENSIVNQALITAFLVVGVTAVSAVAFEYSGEIQLKFGSDGIQLQVDGQDKTKSLE